MRKDNVLRLSRRALAAYSHKQRRRTTEPGNSPPSPRGREFSRWLLVLDAGLHLAALRRWNAMGIKKYLYMKYLENELKDIFIAG